MGHNDPLWGRVCLSLVLKSKLAVFNCFLSITPNPSLVQCDWSTSASYSLQENKPQAFPQDPEWYTKGLFRGDPLPSPQHAS